MAVLAATASGLLVLAPVTAEATPTSCSSLDILAHRGYHYKSIAENTTAAFDQAAAHGYSIETDVWADAEGQLWIFHDRDPFRATGVHGKIDQMTTAAVAALRYKKGGAPLPTFQQALAQWQTFPDARIFVEPKNAITVQLVAPLVHDSGIEDRIYYTAQIQYINQNYPASKTMARSYQVVPDPATFVAQGVDEVAFGSNVLTTQDVDNYHAAGLLVQLRTSNVSADWREAIRLGMDAILTDQPNELLAFCPTALQPPSISSFTPGTGAPGDQVVITGANFTDASRVTFGTSAASFVLDSPTQITATVPGNVAGATQIHVVTPNGEAISTSDFVIPLEITSFSPTAAQRGETVTINGSGFLGADRVRFGSVDAASFTVVSSSQVTAVVPSGASASSLIIVHTPSGQAQSTTAFKIPPVISSFTPTSGSVGTPVTLTGSGFTGTTRVKFGTVTVSYTVDSDTQISTVAPDGLNGQVALSVQSAGGTATSTQLYGTQAPVVTGFSPASAPVGATVTITGTGFTGATSVTFGSVGVPSFTVDSDSQITTTVPAGITASSKIAVRGPGGVGTSSASFVVVAPTITSFTPTSGPAGTVVTITGTGLSGASSVQFGTVAATSFTVDSDTQITTTVPAGVVRAKIRVTTPGGSVTSVALFSSPPPAITSFTPTSGPGGSVVTITGSSFTGTTLIKFGSVSATSYSIDSDGQISVTVPTGVVGPVKIRVSTPNGSVLSDASYTGA